MKRPLGRPPLNAMSPSVDVHLKLPTVDYDKAEQLAKKHRESSLQDLIRKALKKFIEDERG